MGNGKIICEIKNEKCRMGDVEWRIKNEERRMENKEWKIENGEWRKEIRIWGMGKYYGKLKMGYVQWAIESGEWGMESRLSLVLWLQQRDPRVSRRRGIRACDRSGKVLLLGLSHRLLYYHFVPLLWGLAVSLDDTASERLIVTRLKQDMKKTTPSKEDSLIISLHLRDNFEEACA